MPVVIMLRIIKFLSPFPLSRLDETPGQFHAQFPLRCAQKRFALFVAETHIQQISDQAGFFGIRIVGDPMNDQICCPIRQTNPLEYRLSNRFTFARVPDVEIRWVNYINEN